MNIRCANLASSLVGIICVWDFFFSNIYCYINNVLIYADCFCVWDIRSTFIQLVRTRVGQLYCCIIRHQKSNSHDVFMTYTSLNLTNLETRLPYKIYSTYESMSASLVTMESTPVTDVRLVSNMSYSTPAVIVTNQNFSEMNCSCDVMQMISNNITVPSANSGSSNFFKGGLLSIGLAGIIANGFMLTGMYICFVQSLYFLNDRNKCNKS